MFRIFLLLFPCAILAAFTRNIPANPAVLNCAHLQNRTILYFDAHGQPADGAVKVGFYKIIELQGANCILSQEFNSAGNALGGSCVPDCRKSSIFPKKI
ncbi:hypothetical protein CWI61_07900 [Neisseria meningitidis]|uniref:hypothetical protein n=1 Tax=Neisseria meningitidis TaxID=487 RepID=UPI000C6CE8EE|nr:hypothetical protein [Neisseria meningitidis]PKT91732.1 hypothetical protein CWI61_07900 [Neisseria meningitidis]